MKAITLWQPWASLIALGVKTIETRPWATSYRGPLAIHAEQFVADVRAALDRPNREREQDVLDLNLLGVYGPHLPGPTSDPSCRDCGGVGKVCTCHGLPPFERGHRSYETCSCVRVRSMQSDRSPDV